MAFCSFDRRGRGISCVLTFYVSSALYIFLRLLYFCNNNQYICSFNIKYTSVWTLCIWLYVIVNSIWSKDLLIPLFLACAKAKWKYFHDWCFSPPFFFKIILLILERWFYEVAYSRQYAVCWLEYPSFSSHAHEWYFLDCKGGCQYSNNLRHYVRHSLCTWKIGIEAMVCMAGSDV